jgi:Calx-beta domain/FG-GAP-like repeat
VKTNTASRGTALPRTFFKFLLCSAAAALWAMPGTANATLGNYPNTTVQLSANTTVTPDAVPTNTVSINVSTSTNFKGRLEGNPVTGVVRVTDSHPAGIYTVTVKGFDSGGVVTTRTFTLTVTTPPVTCNPVDFKAPADFGAGTNPRSVAIGDFNGDGNQDLAIANQDSSNVSILLGDGVGGFAAATNFPVANGPFQVAVGDFNGDGKQDLVTANAPSNTVSILFGNGAGGFGAAINIPVPNSPDSVAVGDFNGDGRQDLAVGHFTASNVSILLGDGAGGFGPITDFPVSSNSLSVVVGDFNGDGQQDLATANPGTSDVSVLLGNGAGGFGAPTNFSVGANANPISLAVGLFNADNNQDLAVVNQNSSTVSILLGNGAGGFGVPPVNFDVGVRPAEVAVGDFNGDGQQDLAVAISSSGVSVLLGDGLGGFSAAPDFGLGTGRLSIAVGDFNSDGKQDLAIANTDVGIPGTTVSVLLRQCPVAFSIDSVARAEGNAGANTPFVFTVTKTGTTTLTTFVDFMTQDGTATLADNDYQLSSGTLKFASDQATQTITVVVIGDNTVEPDETFTVHLSNAISATIATADGTGTIIDDDAAPTPTPTATATATATATPTATATATPCSATFSENFDGTAAPALPAGWTTAATGGEVAWVTSTTSPASTPNDAFAPDVPSVGNTELTTPIIAVPAVGGILTFQNLFNMEVSASPAGDGLDGMVLEIGIAGAYVDIITAGGSFVTGGYTRTISTFFGSPIMGRPAWSGLSGGTPAAPTYITTTVNLPAAANGQNIQLKWRAATDSSGIAAGAAGVRIDNIVITPASCGTPTPTPTATATPRATATPTAAPTPTPSPTPSATATPTATPTATATTTPTATPPSGDNLSTRGRVETGDNVVIGGFIITGNAPRRLIVRAIGPSLIASGITDALADPTIDLRASDGSRIQANDNWKDTQQAEIEATGIPPQNDLEAAIVATLPPGSYTAIVRGKNQGSGVALLEIYDLDQSINSKLANISTRALVQTGDNVLIGGFMLGGSSSPRNVIVRAIGPSLTRAGLTNVLANPTLELHDGNGTIIASNDNWKDNEAQAHSIKLAGLAPTDDRESALIATLAPGPYTAIVRGVNNSIGIGLVEIYNLQ